MVAGPATLEPFNDHPSTHARLSTSRNKPQKKQTGGSLAVGYTRINCQPGVSNQVKIAYKIYKSQDFNKVLKDFKDFFDFYHKLFIIIIITKTKT